MSTIRIKPSDPQSDCPRRGAAYAHDARKQKETPLDLGICAGYASRSLLAQVRFALSYRDQLVALACRRQIFSLLWHNV